MVGQVHCGDGGHLPGDDDTCGAVVTAAPEHDECRCRAVDRDAGAVAASDDRPRRQAGDLRPHGHRNVRHSRHQRSAGLVDDEDVEAGHRLKSSEDAAGVDISF
ncbi:hypothetical protein CIW51_31760 [Mycolicibacterium sp. P9-22]|nr:hypothetical protein CIW51_31760 [Mycolicibacterium sp. P9-22]